MLESMTVMSEDVMSIRERYTGRKIGAMQKVSSSGGCFHKRV